MDTTEKLINALEEKGYTDGVDVDTETSLYEYGIIRNPKTDDVLYCFPTEQTGLENVFDWSTINYQDVLEALEEMPCGYFDFVGSTLDDEKKYISPEYLTGVISSINSYNGYFQQSCKWDMTEEQALERIASQ